MRLHKSGKIRLDVRVAELFPHLSRTQIQSFIMQGKIFVGGIPVTKAGTLVAGDAHIELKAEMPRFVSRAGEKLAHALDHFSIDVAGLLVLDAGISTGGFTDCLLQHGAAKVHGVDVAYGQVDLKVRNNPRVVLHERTNLRHLRDVGEKVDLITLDLAFISVLKVMDAVCSILQPEGKLIVLIKPQFEAERKDVGKGGIVRDSAVHERVIQKIVSGIEAYGFSSQGITPSPITGGDGNREFLAYFLRK